MIVVKTREQELYLKSFEMAMKDIDDAIKHGTKALPANKELKSMNAWDARWLASQYVLINGKMSKLSKSLRDYVVSVGQLAWNHYETLTKDEDTKEEGSGTADGTHDTREH